MEDPALRADLAQACLRGHGIEIGALHRPLTVPEEITVSYVDRMSVGDLRTHYAELARLPLVEVDIVDDGETLASIPDASIDFIVANHFLEHCQDPIQTITTHLGKLRPGGTLFYAVPDKRYTFDFRRPVTSLEHVIADHERGPQDSRSVHYMEWVTLVDGSGREVADPSDRESTARQLEAADYSIHFHVWTQKELLELILHIRGEGKEFDIEAFRPNGIENIILLRKHGGTAVREQAEAFVSGLMKSEMDRSAVPTDFDPVGYLVQNPDVLAAQMNPYAHFVQHGRAESRRWRP